MTQHCILCKIRKDCKLHLWIALWGLWERSHEKVMCFWVA